MKDGVHDSGFIKGGHPYTVTGTPDPKSGVRLVPPEELAKMLRGNPGLQNAVDLVERHDFNGKPSAIKQLLIKQFKHDLATKLRYESNKRVIDFANKKEKGKV